VAPKKRRISDNDSRKRKKHLAKAKQLLHIINDNDGDGNDNENDDSSKIVERTILLVEECMRYLRIFDSTTTGTVHSKQQGQGAYNFNMQKLIESIHDASNVAMDVKDVEDIPMDHGHCHGDGVTDEIATAAKTIRITDEIICYGIGNFYKKGSGSSKKYNSPLIQLSCVLLLREAFAHAHKSYQSECDASLNHSHSHSQSQSHNNSVHSGKDERLYQQQQDIVPMVYFEPFINAIERDVLAHFHVQVLDVNEQGKRRISNRESNPSTHTRPSTLFYMPHCPMRLYSNVLWANWEKNLLWNGRIVIMGNSFIAYDDRIISSEKRKDRSNGIFPLLPFVSESSVLRNGKNKDASPSPSASGMKLKLKLKPFVDVCSSSDCCGSSLAWHEVELSFNDSAIISFSDRTNSSFGSDGGSHSHHLKRNHAKDTKQANAIATANLSPSDSFPDRPQEYFVLEADEGGEVV